ncbi:MAG: histidine--tRNA ligase, partial [Aquabacterium sp.]|nr:histidine--tRNA ligase [Aquabacterium sp.]
VEAPANAPDAFAVVFNGTPLSTVLTTIEALRAEGVSVALNPAGKDGPASPKSQFKKADASGARYALIFGPDEVAQGQVSIKPLRDGGEQLSRPLAGARDWAASLLSAPQS